MTCLGLSTKVNIWDVSAGDGVLFFDESPDEFPEGFAFLLVDPIEIPFNSRFHKSPLEVVNEYGTEISPGID